MSRVGVKPDGVGGFGHSGEGKERWGGGGGGVSASEMTKTQKKRGRDQMSGPGPVPFRKSRRVPGASPASRRGKPRPWSLGGGFGRVTWGVKP